MSPTPLNNLPATLEQETVRASLNVIPTVYPTSPPLEDVLDRFWDAGPELETITIRVAPAETPLAILELLGPSPFERGGFPLIGFLATTYEKVSRYALDGP